MSALPSLTARWRPRLEPWTPPSIDEPCYSGAEIRALAVAAVRLGASSSAVERMLRRRGVDLEDQHRKFSMREHVAIARAACELAPSHDLAVTTGAQLHLSSFGLAGYALLTCERLRDALDLFAGSLAPLFNLKFSARRRSWGEGASIAFEDVFAFATEDRSFFLALEIAKLTRVLRDLLGSGDRSGNRDPELECVEMEGLRRPGLLRALDSAGRTAQLLVGADLLSTPLPLRDAATHSHCLALCNAMIEEMRTSSDPITRVRSYLEHVDANASLSDVAHHLHLSRRSVRRRLAASGTSYREVVAEVRRDLAQRYLSRSELTIEAIAARLGYSDAANFRHAFKRWTGQPPSKFRDEVTWLPGHAVTATGQATRETRR